LFLLLHFPPFLFLISIFISKWGWPMSPLPTTVREVFIYIIYMYAPVLGKCLRDLFWQSNLFDLSRRWEDRI
jgi:hypothetical protein